MQNSAIKDSRLNYAVREMTEADIPVLVDFYNALEAAEPTEESYSVAEYERRYHEPDRQHCTRLMAHLTNDDGSEGRLIGYGEVYKPDNVDAAWSRLHVLPEYRGRGIGNTLYRQLGQIVLVRKATEWRVSPHQSYKLGIAFWQRRGFVTNRYDLLLRLQAATSVPQPQIPTGFAIRNFVPGQDEAALWRVSNESFAEHYWAEEQTLEELVYWTRQPGFHPSDIIFACADEQVVGFCWTEVIEEDIARRGIAVGWVNDLGVIPAYRRRRLGRTLLIMGIHYLRQRVAIVELGVEDQNQKAMPLYESIGFAPYSGQVDMEKKLTVDLEA